jgi:hypothetical protein
LANGQKSRYPDSVKNRKTPNPPPKTMRSKKLSKSAGLNR